MKIIGIIKKVASRYQFHRQYNDVSAHSSISDNNGSLMADDVGKKGSLDVCHLNIHRVGPGDPELNVVGQAHLGLDGVHLGNQRPGQVLPDHAAGGGAVGATATAGRLPIDLLHLVHRHLSMNVRLNRNPDNGNTVLLKTHV